MIDSHAHILNEYYDNIYGLIYDLKNKNIRYVLNCADSIKTSKEVIESYIKYDGFLLPAVGIHPECIDTADLSELEHLIKNNKVYAVGEIGLDYYQNDTNKEEQKELFNKQLTFDILKKRNLKGIIHCFSGSYEMAKEFIKLGYKLGIGGVLTFKNSKLYQVIEKIDLNYILLETDSPYLSPEPFRGKKNNPANIYYIAKKISEIKNVSVDEVIKKTSENFNDIFDIQ